jgi:hypothetical protein
MKRDDREQFVSKAIAQLEPELPFLTINVPSAVRVPGLTIKRNNNVMHVATWDTELPVDPGEVQIVTTAPGYKPRTQTIKIDKQEHKSVAILALELMPRALPAPEFWTSRRKIGALFLGVGAAGVGLGAFAGLTSLNDRKESDSLCPIFDGERRCTQGGADAMSKAHTAAVISDVGFGVGAFALLAGGYFFFTGAASAEKAVPPPAAGAEAPKPVNASWSWGVVPSATGAHGFITGSF